MLLFADVFSTRVLPHVYGLLRASTPEAVAEVQATLTAGLTVRPIHQTRPDTCVMQGSLCGANHISWG